MKFSCFFISHQNFFFFLHIVFSIIQDLIGFDRILCFQVMQLNLWGSNLAFIFLIKDPHVNLKESVVTAWYSFYIHIIYIYGKV